MPKPPGGPRVAPRGMGAFQPAGPRNRHSTPAAAQTPISRSMPTWKRSVATRRADGDRRRRADRAWPSRAPAARSGPSRSLAHRRRRACGARTRSRGSASRPTTAAVIPASAPRSGAALAQALDVRRAEEDPEEARHVGHPGREHGGERAGEPGRRARPGSGRRRGSRRTAPPGSAGPASSPPCRGRRASRPARASRSSRPPAAPCRRAPRRRRRR